ncbi:MAG: RNA-binding protein [Spirochaetales bacterium]|uniref:RNA-binding protein n=1 Tax=Candidatus Thalassospirochaeta sargassi TaxID=3119039 RepID=A0AAJ1IC09_9SPIO|nr:RNA-binding protein [Spirochaetales bacterium]
MAKKIYVGNISFNAQEDDLRTLFSQYGEVVDVKIITDKYTERSKGFGFIEMQEDSAAEAAISALDGKEMLGRELRVNEAQERKERPRYNDFR